MPTILPPSATELEPAEGIKRKRGASELKSLRIPLNSTGMPNTPRIGL